MPFRGLSCSLNGGGCLMFGEIVGNTIAIQVFSDSLRLFFRNLNLNTGLICVITFFTAVGGVDLLLGNRRGYGAKFEGGFNAMCSLAIPLVGMMSLAPVLSALLQPIASALFSSIGANPAMFPAMLLSSDLGAYSLAVELAGGDVSMQNYSGLLLGSMLGCTTCFTIPVGLSMVKGTRQVLFSLGILIGLTTIPLGMMAGGWAMNYFGNPIGISKMLINIVPVIAFSVLIAISLWFFLETSICCFEKFGKFVRALTIVGVILAVFQYQTGIRIPPFEAMVEPNPLTGAIPFEEALRTLTTIGIFLTGAFPLVEFVNRHFRRGFAILGNRLLMDENGVTGLLAGTANLVPMFDLLDKMNDCSILINAAFAVSASCAFGDFIGFAAGVDPTMIAPMVIGKLTGGLSAILAAYCAAPYLFKRIAGKKDTP